MKLLIAGSRNFVDYDKLKTYCDDKIYNPIDPYIITEIVSGHANGADKLGELYALERNIPIKLFKPNWKKYGKSAGYIRNIDMVKYADIAIFFRINNSRGTTYCLEEWKETKKPYYLMDI